MNSLEDKTMKRTKPTTKTMTWLTVATAAALVLGAAAGCDKNKSEKEKAEAAFFKGDGVERVSPTITVQATNGARHDAMLYPHHFDGGHLNSLGRAKVLLMLEDCENCSPITVHLVNCGEGDVLAQRKSAVELYLKSAEGWNVATLHSAQSDLVRYMKTESGKPEAAETTVDTSAMGNASASAGAAK